MKKHVFGGLALATLMSGSAWAQDVDSALADSWAFMQASMPGIGYDVLEAACAEGAVTIYAGTWTDAQASQVAEFEKQFPCVDASIFELSTGPRRERFLAETAAGNHIVDIVQDTDVGALNQQIDNGMLAEYTISNDASFDPALSRSGFWYPMRISIAVNAWNTDLVTSEEIEILKKWDGVTNPVFKGRVGITGPEGGGATYLPFYALHQLYGDEFMAAFAALEPRVFTLSNVGTALAAGDIDVALAMSETPLTALYLAGAPIQWSMPTPAVGAIAAQAISVNAPHPAAARLYQEYAFTEEGYGHWQRFGGPPARNGFVDQREFASADWFDYPTEFYKYDPAHVNATQVELSAKLKSWFGL
ncbi:ABC transporter substrate-binding protein [Devosia sp. A369]